jgi:hypothetical protein
MILSNQDIFSDAQAITATAASTNILDLGKAGTPFGAPSALIADVAKGGVDIPLDVRVIAAFATLTSLTVSVETAADGDAAFGTPTTIASSGRFPWLRWWRDISSRSRRAAGGRQCPLRPAEIYRHRIERDCRLDHRRSRGLASDSSNCEGRGVVLRPHLRGNPMPAKKEVAETESQRSRELTKEGSHIAVLRGYVNGVIDRARGSSSCRRSGVELQRPSQSVLHGLDGDEGRSCGSPGRNRGMTTRAPSSGGAARWAGGQISECSPSRVSSFPAHRPAAIQGAPPALTRANVDPLASISGHHCGRNADAMDARRAAERIDYRMGRNAGLSLTGIASPILPGFQGDNSGQATFRFTSGSFTYTPPSGFVAM